MPETTEATRTPTWVDSVAVDVRGWISGIKPMHRLSLGRKIEYIFSFNHSESPFQMPVNTALSDCEKVFHTTCVSLKFEIDNITV